jgi:hypothetical protein
MIINIRGTHGSGKSHIVRRIIKRYNAVPESFFPQKTRGKPKIRGYQCTVFGSELFIVGSYETTCGGCDGIQPYNLIWPIVEEYASRGHVVFEGALVICLDRIRQRRASKGNTKPLDPKNTASKYNNIINSIPKIRDEFGRRVLVLDHRKAIAQVLGLLYKAVQTREEV